MKAKMAIVFTALVVTLFTASTVLAAPYQAYEDAITGLMTDLAPVVIAVVGAALALAAGVMIVRIGFRWVKRFLGGA